MSQSVDLASRLAAQDVIVAYANFLDDRDFDGYRELFHPDVELEGFGPEPIHGIESWLRFVERALGPYRQTQHMLAPPRVQIEGDVALLRTDLQALHFLREPKGKIFWLWGAYRTELERGGTRWRIRKHRLDVWSTRSE